MLIICLLHFVIKPKYYPDKKAKPKISDVLKSEAFGFFYGLLFIAMAGIGVYGGLAKIDISDPVIKGQIGSWVYLVFSIIGLIIYLIVNPIKLRK